MSTLSDWDLRSALLRGGHGIWISSGFDRVNRGDPHLVDVLDVELDVVVDVDPEVVYVEQESRIGDAQSCGEPGRLFRMFVARNLLDLVLVSSGDASGGVSMVVALKDVQSRPLRFDIGGSFSLDAVSSMGSSLGNLDGEWCKTGMKNGGK